MAERESVEGYRAVAAWRNLFHAYAQGREIPVGRSVAREVASGEDIADAVLHTALALDELLTTGRLPPDRVAESMLLLLMIRDYVEALPPDPGPELVADFSEAVTALRSSRTADREQA